MTPIENSRSQSFLSTVDGRQTAPDDARLSHLANMHGAAGKPSVLAAGPAKTVLASLQSASARGGAAASSSSSAAAAAAAAASPSGNASTMGTTFPQQDKARRILSPTEAAVLRRGDTQRLIDMSPRSAEEEKGRPDSPGLHRRGGRPKGDSLHNRINVLIEDPATGLPPLYSGLAEEDEAREFFQLVTRNDSQRVRSMLVDHYFRNNLPSDQHGRSPIMVAAQVGAADTLGVLLMSVQDAVGHCWLFCLRACTSCLLDHRAATVHERLSTHF